MPVYVITSFVGSQMGKRMGAQTTCFLPLLCLVVFLLMPKAPDQLVLFSGMIQAIMLPMLSVAALFFRYRRNDRRVSPGLAWDICLWISTVGMFLAAGCLVDTELNKALSKKSTPAVVKPI